KVMFGINSSGTSRVAIKPTTTKLTKIISVDTGRRKERSVICIIDPPHDFQSRLGALLRDDGSDCSAVLRVSESERSRAPPHAVSQQSSETR
ncbi:MAG: hypothetical protein GVY07_02610, partial [Bacteroidetes bacterium]|nr:hypothetical protein [Bacteroidota bacterium]